MWRLDREGYLTKMAGNPMLAVLKAQFEREDSERPAECRGLAQIRFGFRVLPVRNRPLVAAGKCFGKVRLGEVEPNRQ